MSMSTDSSKIEDIKSIMENLTAVFCILWSKTRRHGQWGHQTNLQPARLNSKVLAESRLVDSFYCSNYYCGLDSLRPGKTMLNCSSNFKSSIISLIGNLIWRDLYILGFIYLLIGVLWSVYGSTRLNILDKLIERCKIILISILG